MMLCFVIGSRLVWAMAQKHILLLAGTVTWYVLKGVIVEYIVCLLNV